MALLDVSGLRVEFPSAQGFLTAVEDLDLSIDAGETLALVGESGSGKSVASMAMLGLLPPGTRVTGRVVFAGTNLLEVSPREFRHHRGRDIAIVFQEPMTSLNPVMTIGRQLVEALPKAERSTRAGGRSRAAELLASVGITAPEQRLDEFPHQISGGMRQRVMIAIALAGRPQLIIADEPTTALDVTVQAQIVGLLRSLQAQTGMALLVISHDLALVRQMASRVAVMYAGRKVEEAPTGQLFANPRHPYSVGLIAAIPKLGAGKGAALVEIPGAAPSLAERGPGCAFAPRCPHVAEVCGTPPPTRGVACHLRETLT